jgi:AcrR family transcriptional regulator
MSIRSPSSGRAEDDRPTMSQRTTPSSPRGKNEQQLASILDVALRMADEDGLEAVSIRKLASEIGVAPMTVYGYVASKDDLLNRMAERCLDRFELPVLASSDWADHVRAIMRSLRQLLLSHPALVSLLARRRVMSLGLTRSIDATLHHLRSAGFSGPEAVEAYGALVSFTLGSVVLKLPRSIDEDAADVKYAIRHLRELAEGRFPMVTMLATELSMMARDRTFEVGLESLVEGLRIRLDRRLSNPAQKRRPKQ